MTASRLNSSIVYVSSSKNKYRSKQPPIFFRILSDTAERRPKQLYVGRPISLSLVNRNPDFTAQRFTGRDAHGSKIVKARILHRGLLDGSQNLYKRVTGQLRVSSPVIKFRPIALITAQHSWDDLQCQVMTKRSYIASSHIKDAHWIDASYKHGSAYLGYDAIKRRQTNRKLHRLASRSKLIGSSQSPSYMHV